jgi:hypothetical protein
MTFTALSHTMGQVDSGATVLFWCKLDWTPNSVYWLGGRGRVPRAATWNAGSSRWELTFDPDDTPDGGTTGNPLDPFWNYWCAWQFEAIGGTRHEKSQPRWVYFSKFDSAHVPTSSFAPNAVNDFNPFSATTFSGVEAIYEAVYGSQFAELRPDPNKAGRNIMLIRPDIAKGVTDQPNTSGLRWQGQSYKTIVPGHRVAWACSYLFMSGSKMPYDQPTHVNLFQYYGPNNKSGTSDYDMGTPLALNFSARTRDDDTLTPIISDQGRLISTGNRLNPGLFRPMIDIEVPLDRPVDIGWVADISNGHTGKITWYLNAGEYDRLMPVRQQIPHPVSGSWYETPLLLSSPWHEPQRTDVQAYGDRDSALWPNFMLGITAHKQGAAITDVDPLSYPNGPRQPVPFKTTVRTIS